MKKSPVKTQRRFKRRSLNYEYSPDDGSPEVQLTTEKKEEELENKSFELYKKEIEIRKS